MNAPLSESDHAGLKESLRRCSPETIAAAVRYRETGDLAAIPQVVMGILERFQPTTAPIQLSQANDGMRLIEDLGLDSLTLLEVVMSIEETLKVRVENEELRQIRTLGQLNQFLHAKITGVASPIAGRHYSREQLLLILPQQPPFLFLDSAELEDSVVKARYRIKGEEFFLAGHFKDEPIFPASILFETLGQAACLWVLEKAPAQTGRQIVSNQVYFASLDGAHVYRKTRPGEELEFELRLSKLREPLAVFEGMVMAGGQRVARIERLVLAFGEELQPEKNVEEAADFRSDLADPEATPKRGLQSA